MLQRAIRKTTAPLGHRRNGTPFWALSGAAPDDGDDTGGDSGGSDSTDDGGEDDDSGDSDEDDTTVGDDGLNAKGRKAIQAERTSANRARQRLKPFAQLARETGLTAEQMRERLIGKGGTTTSKKSGTASKDDDEDRPDADEIRRDAEMKAQTRVNDKLIKSAVRAEAASMLTDPADAVRFLDLSDYEVDDDGNVDEKQIKRDLRALLADKPYLGKARKGDGRQGGNPDFDGGSRSTTKKTSMSDAIRRAAGVIR